MPSTPTDMPNAVLAAVQLQGASDADHASDLAELGKLVRTLGYNVVATISQKRAALSRTAVFGAGKLVELAALTGGTGVVESRASPKKDKARLRRNAAQDDEKGGDEHSAAKEPVAAAGVPKAEMIVVDHEISPSQLRNLERATGAHVLDRTAVIVEIFHRHAKSRAAKLEVELARLAYMAPRLREVGENAQRQRGGVGGRGTGETALDLDRHRIRDRMARVREELAALVIESDVRRSHRREQRRVALVGYTNAGKSSLMHALTASDVLIADQLFATLDTTVRALQPESRPRVLVSDTVGFIKKLPHALVASFRSTLDEAREASLLLFVADASDPTFRSQLEVTRTVLGEIGVSEVPSRLLLNKIDRLDAAARTALAREFPEAILLSAKSPSDIATLRQAILAFFEASMVEGELLIPYVKQHLVRVVHNAARVVSEVYDESGARMRVLGDAAELARLKVLIES